MASGLPRNASFGSVSSMSTGSSQNDSSNIPYADLNASQDSLNFGARPEVKATGFFEKLLSSPLAIIGTVVGFGVALAGAIGLRKEGWLRTWWKGLSKNKNETPQTPNSPTTTAEKTKEGTGSAASPRGQTPPQTFLEKFKSKNDEEKIEALNTAKKDEPAQHVAMLDSVKDQFPAAGSPLRRLAFEQASELAKNDPAYASLANDLARQIVFEHRNEEVEVVLEALKRFPNMPLDETKEALIEAASRASDKTFKAVLDTAMQVDPLENHRGYSIDRSVAQTILQKEFDEGISDPKRSINALRHLPQESRNWVDRLHQGAFEHEDAEVRSEAARLWDVRHPNSTQLIKDYEVAAKSSDKNARKELLKTLKAGSLEIPHAKAQELLVDLRKGICSNPQHNGTRYQWVEHFKDYPLYAHKRLEEEALDSKIDLNNARSVYTQLGAITGVLNSSLVDAEIKEAAKARLETINHSNCYAKDIDAFLRDIKDDIELQQLSR